MSVQDEQGVVLAVGEHEELESVSEPIGHVAEAELVTRREEVDFVEPETAEQIHYCRVLPDQHCSFWYVCKSQLV